MGCQTELLCDNDPWSSK